jgi:hypothetical protein
MVWQRGWSNEFDPTMGLSALTPINGYSAEGASGTT